MDPNELIAVAIDTYVCLKPQMEREDGVPRDRIPDPNVSSVEVRDGQSFVILRHATDSREIPIAVYLLTRNGSLEDVWPDWVDEDLTFVGVAGEADLDEPTLR